MGTRDWFLYQFDTGTAGKSVGGNGMDAGIRGDGNGICVDGIEQEIEDLFSKIIVSGSANQIQYNLKAEIVPKINVAVDFYYRCGLYRY
jgi:hypothetical protein